MTALPISLVLVSTVMHAAWNLCARRARAEATCFLRMQLIIAAAGLVPAVVSEAITGSLPLAAWGCLAGSGVACGLYYVFLALGYRSSDFTVVYPMARALPVLLVAVGDVWRGRQLTGLGWLGIVLVAVGCLLVPLERLRDFQWRRYLNRTGLWIVLTALGTVGYTLFDKVAAEIVHRGPATAARYGYFFFLITLVVYLPLYRRLGLVRAEPNSPGWRVPVVAGICNFGAYWLVLWAYQLADQASYIVAFRQFSIVIGVVLAFMLYKEHGWRVRLLGTAIMTAGLVAIGLGG